MTPSSPSSASAATTASMAAASPALSTLLWPLLQMVMATAVVWLFGIENEYFVRLFLLVTVGFAINLALPLTLRLPFFCLLCVAGTFVVFSPGDALWLLGAGGVLIAACHLPVSFRVRVGVVALLALLLAVSRAGIVRAPWTSAVWPILGSMFMFRLVLYMMAVRTGQLGDRPFWGAVAYFFMLPNLAFPLYPVVDYQTFRRTHYDRPEASIYETGLQWIARGLLHLVLYRLVYHDFLNDPVDVVRLGDLVQFMLGTFLLYLRVSGQFHLIVGILHLFGFRLPETHKLYYLAHDFIELWRRINIYWTDFMMKTVFYPTYFRVKKLGPKNALIVSTSAVFVTTWLLHSYQWFWLRNGFPLTLQDAVFWGLLGLFVVRGAVRELTATRKAKAPEGWNWHRGLQAATTFGFFCFLWSLWSTESVTQWVYMLGAATAIDLRGVLMLAGTLGLVFVLGARDWNPARTPKDGVLGFIVRPATRATATLLFLLVIGQPGVLAHSHGMLQTGLKSIHTVGLNARDAALNRRGYYEQLDVRGQLTDVVFDIVGVRTANWLPFATTGVLRERSRDLLTRDLVPSSHVVWNGEQLSTNQWGMRDQEYTREVPTGTLRVALFGPSLLMGSGVSDGQDWESVLERRLNQEGGLPAGYSQIELLNFGVEGHTFPEQLAMLQNRGFDFTPDIAIATMYYPTRAWTERYILKIINNDAPIQDPDLRQLLETAGLGETRGDVAVPFPLGRQLARMVGLTPRMPSAEQAAKVRRVTDAVVEWSIRKFAQEARAKGVVPAVIALNAVIEDEPDQVPHLNVLREAGLPLIDLFHVYPADQHRELKVAEYDEHPNVRGNQLIADQVHDRFVQLLHAAVAERAAGRATAQGTAGH